MKFRDLLLAPAIITFLLSLLFFCEWLGNEIRQALSHVYLSILGWLVIYVGWAMLAALCTVWWAKLLEKEAHKK